MFSPALVVIHDFDLESGTDLPDKANPPLIANTYAVSAFSVAFELLQPISRRHAQIRNTRRAIQHSQFTKSLSLNIRGQSPRTSSVKQPLSFFVLEAFNHILGI